MENIQSIKARIKTIQNIQKAANAMKLISSIKLNRLNNINIDNLRLKSNIIKNILSMVTAESIFYNIFPSNHWIFRKNTKSLIIVLSTDQGFCGSFKQSIIDTAQYFIKKHNATYIELFGKKVFPLKSNVANSQFDRTIQSRYEIKIFATKLKDLILDYIYNYEVSNIYIISGEFKSILKQTTSCRQIYPINIKDFKEFNKIRLYDSFIETFDFIFEKYLYSVCFELVYEHLLSELSIRVMSMDKTYRNAEDMCKNLILLYNRTRQAKITQELTEIVSSVECIK